MLPPPTCMNQNSSTSSISIHNTLLPRPSSRRATRRRSTWLPWPLPQTTLVPTTPLPATTAREHGSSIEDGGGTTSFQVQLLLPRHGCLCPAFVPSCFPPMIHRSDLNSTEEAILSYLQRSSNCSLPEEICH
jgi:hypothetical protein